jgi:hypothetical protein
MKRPRASLMGTPLLFIVACAELVGGDDASAVHDCRHAPTAAAPKVVPAPPAPKPVRCDDGEAPPELWDGTGRSEAVRGA